MYFLYIFIPQCCMKFSDLYLISAFQQPYLKLCSGANFLRVDLHQGEQCTRSKAVTSRTQCSLKSEIMILALLVSLGQLYSSIQLKTEQPDSSPCSTGGLFLVLDIYPPAKLKK